MAQTAESRNLSRRVGTAAKWGYAGTAAKVVVQLVAQAALARILGPEEYGVFAAGFTVVAFSIFFADSGVGAGLIQREVISRQLMAFALGTQMLTGVVVAVIVWFLAEPVAEFYAAPRAANVIRGLAPVICITAFGSIAASLLKRELDFKTLQIGQVVGFVFGYVFVAIPLAVMGAGVWSLVLAWLVQSTISVTVWYVKVRHPLIPKFKVDGAKSLLEFGGVTIVSNVSTWASGTVDKLIVGHRFPSSALGLYTVPYTLLGTAASQVLTTIQPIFFASAARLAKDKLALRIALVNILELVSLILLPTFAAIAAVSAQVIEGIYGPSWIGAASVMRAAAIGMTFYTLSALGTPVLWALGRVKSEAVPQLAATVALLAISIWLAQYSLECVAWGGAIVSLARCLWVYTLLLAELRLDFGIVMRALRPAVVATMLVVVAESLTATALEVQGIGAVFRLGVLVVVGTAVLMGTILLMKGRLLSQSLTTNIDGVQRKLTRMMT